MATFTSEQVLSFLFPLGCSENRIRRPAQIGWGIRINYTNIEKGCGLWLQTPLALMSATKVSQ